MVFGVVQGNTRYITIAVKDTQGNDYDLTNAEDLVVILSSKVGGRKYRPSTIVRGNEINFAFSVDFQVSLGYYNITLLFKEANSNTGGFDFKKICLCDQIYVKGCCTSSTGQCSKVPDDINFEENSLEVIAQAIKYGIDGKSAYELWLDAGHSGTINDFFDWLKGVQGEQGEQGEKGDDGLSAYEIWLLLGNQGTMDDFLASLKGDSGESAYAVWLSLGNVGTEQDFINSLKGEKGDKGNTGDQGIQGPIGDTGPQGERGEEGLSAYQVWIAAGNVGNVEDFFESLKGEKGDIGDTGAEGKSAYQVWLDEGNTGTVVDFFNSLKGDTGEQGDKGDPGNSPRPSATNTWEYFDDITQEWVDTGIALDSVDRDELEQIINVIVDNKFEDYSSIKFSIVTELPTIGNQDVIYLIRQLTGTTLINKYDVYIWVEQDNSYELLKSVSIYNRVSDLEDFRNRFYFVDDKWVNTGLFDTITFDDCTEVIEKYLANVYPVHANVFFSSINLELYSPERYIFQYSYTKFEATGQTEYRIQVDSNSTNTTVTILNTVTYLTNSDLDNINNQFTTINSLIADLESGKISSEQLTSALAGYLPLSGGQMVGHIIMTGTYQLRLDVNGYYYIRRQNNGMLIGSVGSDGIMIQSTNGPIAVTTSSMTINGNEVVTQPAIDDLEERKQDKLTAGSGITIEPDADNNLVISADANQDIQVVTELPSTGEENVLYLLIRADSSSTIYDQYIWKDGQWELIGSSSVGVDLTDYYTIQETKDYVTDNFLPKVSPIATGYYYVNNATTGFGRGGNMTNGYTADLFTTYPGGITLRATTGPLNITCTEAYINGNLIATSDNAVLLTEDQIIEGIKTFVDDVYLQKELYTGGRTSLLNGVGAAIGSDGSLNLSATTSPFISFNYANAEFYTSRIIESAVGSLDIEAIVNIPKLLQIGYKIPIDDENASSLSIIDSALNSAQLLIGTNNQANWLLTVIAGLNNEFSIFNTELGNFALQIENGTGYVTMSEGIKFGTIPIISGSLNDIDKPGIYAVKTNTSAASVSDGPVNNQAYSLLALQSATPTTGIANQMLAITYPVDGSEQMYWRNFYTTAGDWYRVPKATETPQFGTIRALSSITDAIDLGTTYDIRYGYSGEGETLLLGDLSGAPDGMEYILSIINSGTGTLFIDFPVEEKYIFEVDSIEIGAGRIGELSIRYIEDKYTLRVIGE